MEVIKFMADGIFSYRFILFASNNKQLMVQDIKTLGEYRNIYTGMYKEYAQNTGAHLLLILPDGQPLKFSTLPTSHELRNVVICKYKSQSPYCLRIIIDNEIGYFWNIQYDDSITAKENIWRWVIENREHLSDVTSIELWHHHDKQVEVSDVTVVPWCDAPFSPMQCYQKILKESLAASANYALQIQYNSYFFIQAVNVSAIWLQYVCIKEQLDLSSLMKDSVDDNWQGALKKLFSIITNSNLESVDKLREIYMTAMLAEQLYDTLLPVDDTCCYSTMQAFVEVVQKRLQ